MENNYDVYSEFNIDKHAEHFINYLEVVIDRTGKVFYAVPSHTIFLENVLKVVYGEDTFKEMLKEDDAYSDYAGWLCTKTNAILVWDNFYVCGKNGLTEAQIETLKQLQVKKYLRGGNSLFRGEIKGI